MENKIKELEERISALEKPNKNRLFGRSYTQLGDSNTDIILLTKGQIKVKYGNKFFDLIKDGKVNADLSDIIKRLEKLENKDS